MEWHIFKCAQSKATGAKFLIDCKLKQISLELSIVQNNVAWMMEIHQDMIKSLAQKLKMDSIQYLKMLKEHFNSDNAEFEFTKNEFVLYTIFDKIKVKYLQCKLSKVQSIFDCVSSLVQTMYEEKNNANKEVTMLRAETENLRKSTTELKSKLNEFISTKKKEEDILYSNFVLILNEKKGRIQHLTELLEAFRHGRPTINLLPQLKEKPLKSVKLTKVEVKNEVSESESEENQNDYDTDEEHVGNDKKVSESKINKENGNSLEMLSHNISEENRPSTSKIDSYSNFLDDSSPPSYILPKRQKYSHEKRDSDTSLPFCDPGPSKCDWIKKENETVKESPCDTYNTQDLLDQI